MIHENHEQVKDSNDNLQTIQNIGRYSSKFKCTWLFYLIFHLNIFIIYSHLITLLNSLTRLHKIK